MRFLAFVGAVFPVQHPPKHSGPPPQFPWLEPDLRDNDLNWRNPHSPAARPGHVRARVDRWLPAKRDLYTRPSVSLCITPLQKLHAQPERPEQLPLMPITTSALESPAGSGSAAFWISLQLVFGGVGRSDGSQPKKSVPLAGALGARVLCGLAQSILLTLHADSENSDAAPDIRDIGIQT